MRDKKLYPSLVLEDLINGLSLQFKNTYLRENFWISQCYLLIKNDHKNGHFKFARSLFVMKA